MSEEIRISLNATEVETDVNELGQKVDDATENIDVKLTEADVRTDVTWLKAAQTVQQINGILMKSLSVAGLTLGKIGQAAISMVNTAAATLTPLLSSQVMTGWQTATAVLGLIELGIALYELPYLIEETNEAKSWDTAFLEEANSGIGNIAFTTG